MNIRQTFPQLKAQTLPADLTAELLRLSDKLETATDELKNNSINLATKENSYTQAKATNFLKYQTDSNGNKRTVAAIEAIVDKECETQRFECYMARAMKEASLELVKSLRAQLSALQSIAASVRSEMELSKY